MHDVTGSPLIVPSLYLFGRKVQTRKKKIEGKGTGGGKGGYNRAFVLFEVSNLLIDCHALLIRVVR